MVKFVLVLISVFASLSARAIIGGRDVMSQDPLSRGIVGIENSRGGCTGTLIASDVVLTAAHCIHGDSAPMLIVFATSPFRVLQQYEGMTFSSTADRTRQFPQVFISKRVSVHPNYSSTASSEGCDFSCILKNVVGTGSSDLALIQLDRAAPADQVVALPGAAAPDLSVQYGLLLGNGRESETDEKLYDKEFYSLHLKAFSVKKMNSLESLFAKFEMSSAEQLSMRSLLEPSFMTNSDIGFIPVTLMGSATDGDSGGPILITVGNQYQIIGVSSQVVRSNKVPILNVYTSLTSPRNHQWVQSELGKFKNAH